MTARSLSQRARRRVRGLFLLLWMLALVACGQTPTASQPVVAQASPPPTSTATPPPTATAAPLPSATLFPSPSPTSEPTATATATDTPSPTPDPYAALSIAALATRQYGGGHLQIEETLDQNEQFARYLISYPSDGLRIYGYMNVPNDGWKFPVAIVLHGYIPPSEYETVAYTERYANALVEAGYFVIHPNFRNYPPSDSGPDPFRIGFAVDVLNLIAIIREQSQDPTGPLRRADADAIHLMGHSMGGGVALRVLTVNPAPYLRAAVLYGSMSGDEAKNYARIQEWSNGRNGQFELNASPEQLQAISPIFHLERIETPISIHHSDADAVVPFAWSEELCNQLMNLNHPVECFTYAGQPHTFRGGGDERFMERMIAFFDRY